MAGRVQVIAKRSMTFDQSIRATVRKSSFNVKEKTMSIIRLAVEAHSRKSGLGIREILATAYFKKYGKPMPETALMEDVRRWNHGECNISYLYDFVMKTCES